MNGAVFLLLCTGADLEGGVREVRPPVLRIRASLQLIMGIVT